jgi:exosortase/archaeosortase family protein
MVDRMATASRGLALRGAAFLLVFALLQLSWQGLRGTWLQHLVVHDLVVWPAALIVNCLTPAAHAWAAEYSIRAAGGGLNILNGCEGMEALFLLLAAFVIAPLGYGWRLRGLLLGIGVVYLVNQLRILALFYAYRTDHALFDALHGTVTPIAVVIAVGCYFHGWLAYARRHANAAA